MAPTKKTKNIQVVDSNTSATPTTTTSAIAVVEDKPIDSSSEESASTKKKLNPVSKESVLQNYDSIMESINSEIELIRNSSSGGKSVSGVKFLRSLNKKLKILKNQSSRLIKSKKSSSLSSEKSNKVSGFLKPVKISKEMAKFTGWDANELKSRVDVTKYLCEYIKEHNLQNPVDRRQILADSKLSKLLKYDASKESPLTYFLIQKCLKNHFIKTTDTTAVATVTPVTKA